MAPSDPSRAATTFLLIRHAESAANAGGYFGSHSDSPLTARGIVQRDALVAALRDAPITAVYSSDLSRAIETVRPLADARALTVETTPLLRERNVGEFTGMSFEAARSAYPDVWKKMVARDPDVAPPGGESHRDLAARVRRFLDTARARHVGGTVVIGSHGGTTHHLIRELIGASDPALPFWFSVANASVSRVDVMIVSSGVTASRLTYVNRVVQLGDTDGGESW